MAGHMGVDKVTTQNLRVVQTDVERGLILVEGAVPGNAGGWIAVRDAVKKPLPKDAPAPGKFRVHRRGGRRRAAGRSGEGRVTAMKFDMTSIDGSAAGSLELSDAVFGLEPRADLIARMVRWQLAKRQAGTHQTLGRADIHRTGKKMYKQKGTGGARHGSARVPQFRGGGRAMGPVARSHAHDLPKKVRALALKHALSAKVRAGGLVIWESADVAEAKTKTLRATFEKAALKNALIIDGADAACEVRRCGAQPAADRRAAGPGRQRLRHHAAREAGPDQGRGRSAGGAVQMIKDVRHYDAIVSPVITEKATLASENNQFVFKVARNATKPQIKAAIEQLFDVKVTAVNTLVRKGKTKAFRGVRGRQQDMKKAIVTLADGYRIDMTTGL